MSSTYLWKKQLDILDIPIGYIQSTCSVHGFGIGIGIGIGMIGIGSLVDRPTSIFSPKKG